MVFDHETNILLWEISKGKISQAKIFGNIIIHLSAQGKPVIIEILDASKYLNQFDKLKLKEMQKLITEN